MTLGSRIALRIKKARIEKGLTQAELAKKLGMSTSYIGQYESGNRKPKQETLLKIADALDVSPASLGVEIYTTFPDGEFSYEQIDLLNTFELLNETGQREALKRLREMTRLQEYQAPPAPSKQDGGEQSAINTQKDE